MRNTHRHAVNVCKDTPYRTTSAWIHRMVARRYVGMMVYVRNVRKVMCMWAFNAYPRKWLYLVVTFIALMENVNCVKMGLICSRICACLLRKFKSLCLLKLWALMVPLASLWKALLRVVNLYKVLSVFNIILLILRSKPIFNNNHPNNPIRSEGKKMI